MDLSFQIIPFFGILALLYTFWKTSWIKKQDPGTEKMQKIIITENTFSKVSPGSITAIIEKIKTVTELVKPIIIAAPVITLP